METKNITLYAMNDTQSLGLQNYGLSLTFLFNGPITTFAKEITTCSQNIILNWSTTFKVNMS